MLDIYPQFVSSANCRSSKKKKQIDYFDYFYSFSSDSDSGSDLKCTSTTETFVDSIATNNADSSDTVFPGYGGSYNSTGDKLIFLSIILITKEKYEFVGKDQGAGLQNAVALWLRW